MAYLSRRRRSKGFDGKNLAVKESQIKGEGDDEQEREVGTEQTEENADVKSVVQWEKRGDRRGGRREGE